MKKMSEFLSENFQCLVVKFLIYLHRRVFIMAAIFYRGDDFSHFTFLNTSPYKKGSSLKENILLRGYSNAFLLE